MSFQTQVIQLLSVSLTDIKSLSYKVVHSCCEFCLWKLGEGEFSPWAHLEASLSTSSHPQIAGPITQTIVSEADCTEYYQWWWLCNTDEDLIKNLIKLLIRHLWVPKSLSRYFSNVTSLFFTLSFNPKFSLWNSYIFTAIQLRFSARITLSKPKPLSGKNSSS